MTEHRSGDWPLVNASVPNAARIKNYFLGGKDTFAADREMAEQLEALAQQAGVSVRELVKTSQRFTLKAAQWAASGVSGASISQFLVLGCGLPSRPAVHDAARDGCEDATVVYADKDPMVFSHVAALQAGPGLAVVKADASDPARVLGLAADVEHPGGEKLLDLRKPACVVLGGALSGMDAEEAREAVKGYAGALAAGSAIVLACISYGDPVLAAAIEGLFGTAGTWRNHLLADVTSFFGGLRIVRGKVADVKCWPMLPEESPGACVLGGIGIKD